MTVQIHYAFQACDTKSNQGQKRYCGNDRTILSKKSLLSFLNSVTKAAKSKHGKDSIHNVMIFADNCSDNYLEYIKQCILTFSKNNVTINIEVETNPSSLMKTVRKCWSWLEIYGQDIVYQVQDDYIFFPSAIEEMISLVFQIISDCDNHHPIVVPYNNPFLWLDTYRYNSIPLVVIPSKERYWVQCYDIPCSFMTTKIQFSKHWDLYEKFLSLPSTYEKLESETLNRILVDRNVLGLQPITSVALHMQSEKEKDPYIDWQSLWKSININKVMVV